MSTLKNLIMREFDNGVEENDSMWSELDIAATDVCDQCVYCGKETSPISGKAVLLCKACNGDGDEKNIQ